MEQYELAKGYEYTKDEYVIMEAADFQNLLLQRRVMASQAPPQH